ncbi:MAG: LuxR family transcriptional regulator [Streptosporangiales bacterium]|nr:LuxR family transcriptional regulator [Streptosporangiales bacterium]
MEGFVGRTAEMAEVSRLLADARLVTVTGPGGIGKTRLALRAARQSGDRYPDGVRVAELAGLADPALLPHMVAAALGMMRQETRQQPDAVLHYLRSRRLLLVLDTCEHVIDECALFAEAVLRDAPGVTILATSRQALDVSGECVYQLAPLPVRDSSDLFAQCAAAAVPGFSVTDDNREDVTGVCRRLEGIPLAIELAAARLRSIPLRDLNARLGSSLRGTIRWSYELCDPAEQLLWERLSLFAGPFSAGAARDVCSGHGVPPGDVMLTLVGLVEKSVVARDGDRYRMLDTVREFGAGMLARSGQERIYRGRQAGWYLEMARSFGEHFLDHDQPERMRALRAEHDNLRTTLKYALGSDSERLVRDGAELASSLYGYWMASGLLREGRYWLGMALEKLPPGPSPERAWALVTRAFLGPVAGEPEAAVAEAAEGVQMARDLGDDGPLLARGCLFRQFALMFAGQSEDAFAAGDEARRRLSALEDQVGMLILEGQTAYLQSTSGNLPEAIEACKRGLDRLSEGSPDGKIGEQWLQGFLYLNAGLARFFQGGYDDAERFCCRALAIQVELQDIHGCSYALEGLAWLAANKDRCARAAWLQGAADHLWRELGARLVNDFLLEELHRQTEEAARRGLGDSRYGELFARGGGQPLDRVAAYAVGDADDLPLIDGGADEPLRRAETSG